jgi:sugar/nucleoside kinase (ribokinase family)
MKLKLLSLVTALFFATLVFASNSYEIYFSPREGVEAFEKVYETISNARDYAHITIYSWSDSNIDKAIEKALANGAKVRVVLHPPLAATASTKSKVE